MNVQTRLDSAEQQAEFAPAEATQSNSTQVSLIEIWQIARLRARVILGAAAAILILVALIDLSLTPLYKGSAIVMIDQRENKVVNVEAVLSGLPTDQASILNQIQILQSRELAWRVIQRLGLDKDPEFNGALRKSWTSYLAFLSPSSWFPGPPMSEQERQQKLKDGLISKFEARLGVQQLELSTALKIDFESENANKAAMIANAVADAYVEDQLNAKFEATLKATQWLGSRLGQLADQARRAQDAVEQYKAAHHITEVTASTGSGTISVLDQQIAALNTQLIQAHTDVAQAEANLARVRTLVSSGHAAEVTQVVGSTLIGTLIAQQTELIQKQAEMSTRYGPDHPKMLDLQAEKRDLDAKIKEEISHVVGTAENDVAVARAREASLQSSLNQLESDSTVQGEARVRLRVLEANAASSQALYDTFVARSKETQQQEGLQIPDARVISRSAIPNSPSYPNNILVFGVAIVASLFTGFVVAFLLERLDHGFRTSTRAEAVLGLPVLSTLPDVTPARSVGFSPSHLSLKSQDGPSLNAADLVIERPLSSYAEAVRALQLGIALSNVDNAPKVVLITSALPGEGKTTTAVSLARHLSQTGQKVVLVDGDLRRPNVKSVAELGEISKDLIDLLKGDVTLEEALMKDPKSGVMILPAAKHVKNAPDLIESQSLAKTIKDLSKVFDYVIIDSAPILPVTDTRVLSRLADAVLFVVRWEKTPRDAAADAIKSLRDSHAPIAGVALTRADTKRFHYYSFGYGSYYYAYAKYYEA
ncbi:MAG TPA: polysaccharide biosynthesis tyrosine autokinase [Rhizomicrobium sp.]|nr:polysaccharide biosynthesis tyrosine autokinase [Rhizomicrobium sp.]